MEEQIEDKMSEAHRAHLARVASEVAYGREIDMQALLACVHHLQDPGLSKKARDEWNEYAAELVQGLGAGRSAGQDEEMFLNNRLGWLEYERYSRDARGVPVPGWLSEEIAELELALARLREDAGAVRSTDDEEDGSGGWAWPWYYWLLVIIALGSAWALISHYWRT